MKELLLPVEPVNTVVDISMKFENSLALGPAADRASISLIGCRPATGRSKAGSSHTPQPLDYLPTSTS